MQQRVKEFIEDYIEEIDLHRWEEVFEAWYQETDPNEDIWTDEIQCSELLSALYTIDIDKQKLFEARCEVIAIHTEDIVNTLLHNNYNRVDLWFIYWSDLITRLNSILSLSQEDIFTEVFNELDLAGVTPDYNKQRFVVEGL